MSSNYRSLPIISVQGTPHECGMQHGIAAASQIQKSVDLYLRLFEHHGDMNRSEVITRAKLYVSIVADIFPDMFAELQGIAEGSNCSLEEIMMINCRTELLSKVPLRNCTSMAAIPPATETEKVLLGQTWDWLSVTEGNTIVLKITPSNKQYITMIVEAGQIGKMGFNHAGLGLCHNSLEATTQKVGLPFLVICRAILNCSDIASAINVLYKYPRASAGNFLLAHRDGFAIDFEASEDEVEFLEPENGILVHTNHYISSRFRSVGVGLTKENGDSLVRRQLALSMLRKSHGHIDLETMFEAQSDRRCGPYSVCTVPAEDDPPLAQWSTLAGMVFDLKTNDLYLAAGRPTKSNYELVVP